MVFKTELSLITSGAASAYSHYREISRERWFRWRIRKHQNHTVPGFFDAYPRFLESSKIEELTQINYRHRYLIEHNRDLIKGRRVLDIASHDGRFSFAAAQAGAAYVLGIEARPRLVRAAIENIEAYETPNVEFICGDVFQELDRIEEKFDTVFCFGFLYHTLDHMPLLRKIARLEPQQVIIDTAITPYPGCFIQVREEEITLDTQGAVGEPGRPEHIVIGAPTREALELMLKAVGFNRFEYFNWQALKLKSWHGIKHYYVGRRITVTASR